MLRTPSPRTRRLCNKRDIDGIARCELLKGHAGTHYAELKNGIVEWGEDLSAVRPRRRSKNSSLNGESEYTAAAEIFTDGIKATRISAQITTYGFAYCRRCGKQLSRKIDPVAPSSEPDLEQYTLALAEAMANSHKHHLFRRQGHGYRPSKHGNDFGCDSPLLIEAPVCDDCHIGPDSELHPGPQFGVVEEKSA
jgi:hypothetical protein